MNRNNIILRFILLVVSLSSLLVLASCTGTYSPFHYTESDQQQHSPDYYLKLANQSQEPQRSQYFLMASRRYLENGQTKLGKAILKQVDRRNLTSQDEEIDYTLVKARLALVEKRNQSSLNLLNDLTKTELTPEQAATYHSLLANLYYNQGKLAQSLAQRIKLNSFLTTPDNQAQNQAIIWQNLQSLSLSQLQKLQQQTHFLDMQAWIKLALIAKQNTQNPLLLQQALQQWQQTYPQHAANALLVNNPSQLLKRSHHIAILLPLHGGFSTQANAVKNGFMAAFYQNQRQGARMPNVDFYNTSHKDITTVYQNALNKGADFIIGPLTKTHINQLLDQTTISVPTLALNYSETNTALPNNFYEFGLSPNDEINQITRRAWQDGHSQAILIYPDSVWGKNLGLQLEQHWQQLGGKIIGSLAFQPGRRLSTEIKGLLQVDQSVARYRNLRSLLNEKIQFTPRSRHDADVILLVANPMIARQIRPLLTFYYAGNIPIYATSMVYNGYKDTAQNRDLNGILFCDIPWILKPKSYSILKHSIRSAWGKSYRHNRRLYALGVDAYDLVAKGQLNFLQAMPRFGINGATGALHLSHQRIQRTLDWAKFINGKAELKLRDIYLT